jgi:hypothetical protein
MTRPPQFTEAQWADILEWYQQGYENGLAEGYFLEFREAWHKAWHATAALLPEEYRPRTPWRSNV